MRLPLIASSTVLVTSAWSCPAMRPLREPLRSLIFCAAERAVRDVYVDGRQVVRDGTCLTIDIDRELDALEAAQRRSVARVPELDWAGRSIDELAPMALAVKKA